MTNDIWVFNGEKSTFPSGVFIDLREAEDWISKHQLTGILTLYPVGIGLYDWAIKERLFIPKSDEQLKPKFIQRFSSACLQHHHYLDGVCETRNTDDN